MNVPIDLDSLAGIGLTQFQSAHLAQLSRAGTAQPMRVVEVQRDHVLLHDAASARRAAIAPALARELDAQFDALAVGDWVLAEAQGHLGCQAAVLLPRHSQIARRTNDGRGGVQRQLLAANVDLALLVMGLDHDFNPRRLERYVTLAGLADVGVLLVLTKADGVAPGELDQRLAQAREVLPPELPALAVDARGANAAAQLAPWLQRGRTLVMLGSSGAGKSTLTNTLTASRLRTTSAVREDDSRGRHTTTVRSMQFTAGGACIIDTPGLRALRLDVDSRDDLAGAFADVERWAAQCRFRNCRHLDEPDCAVRQAVPEQRLRNYHKLQREARRDARSALERAQEVALWKARHRAGVARMHAKRGM